MEVYDCRRGKRTKKVVTTTNNHDIMALFKKEMGALMEYKIFESYMVNDALGNIDDIKKFSVNSRYL